MDNLPTQQLNPRIKAVWRINDAIWIILGFFCCFAPFAIAGIVAPELWVGIVLLAELCVFALLLIVFLVVLPPIRFMRWRYEITPEYLDIAKGIIWRKRYVIPFIRVQNTDTRQGPVLRAFRLSSVTVSTAAGSHEIPGLDSVEADMLRDKAAELARLAREDV